MKGSRGIARLRLEVTLRDGEVGRLVSDGVVGAQLKRSTTYVEELENLLSKGF